MRIALVGCGFLGSLFAEEVTKRLFAFETRVQWAFVDDDVIDDRNPANHLFTLQDVGQAKVRALKNRMRLYAPTAVDTLAYKKRVGPKSRNFGQMLAAWSGEAGNPLIVVDAVDNLPTRHWLWRLGKLQGFTVLHLGVSQLGTGAVEWTRGDAIDTFSLSPIALAAAGLDGDAQAQLTQLDHLPPCDLVGFRGLGLNVAVAGAKAVGCFAGLDPENTAPPAASGTMTTWLATNFDHTLTEVARV